MRNDVLCLIMVEYAVVVVVFDEFDAVRSRPLVCSFRGQCGVIVPGVKFGLDLHAVICAGSQYKT